MTLLPLMRAVPALVLLTLGLQAVPVEGQRVVGRVIERGGGGPVSGAMVQLIGVDGPVGRGWLTAVDGRFNLQSPQGGLFRLRVERIGFATTDVEGVSLVEDGMVSIDVVVEAEAINLEGLKVEAAGGRCRVTEGGAVTQALWDEARKALSAASWTESEVELRFLSTVWERQISPRTSQILFEKSEQLETFGANSVRSLPPAELVSDGYVQMQPGYILWYAPDARVLLSDEFQETHCFHLEERETNGTSYLGLGFTPVRERTLPDVSGVIWLDAASARLDHVEFAYENFDLPGSNRARGVVRFSELADGRWIVSDWMIQAPISGGGVGTPAASRRGALAAVQEVGSRVELAEGDGLMWEPNTPPGTVTGVVFDSVSGGVLAGAEVRIAGRRVRALTNLDGRFELKGVPAGLHRLTFSHPDLDSASVTPGFVTVDVGDGAVADVILAVPRWVTMLASSCGARGANAVVGIVRTRDARTLGGVTVEVVARRRGDGSSINDVTDSHGGFVLCDVPADVTQVVASRGRARSEAVEVRVSATTFSQADLTLTPPPNVQAENVPGALLPAIVGTILAQDSRRPLEDVLVRLLDEAGEPIDSDLSDSQGRFRIVLDGGVPVVFLSVERLGYTGAVSEALDLTNGTQRVEVLLPEEAIQLEPVLVMVDGRVEKLEQVGFYVRATTTPGLFIRRDDIEAVAPARTSDLLGRAPGVRVMTNALEGDLRRRVVFNRLTLASGEQCYPSVYVDGEMIRAGGVREAADSPVIEGVESPQGENVLSLDELVPPQEIEAVEMYATPGQVPRRFTGLGTRCGVIVIWTRARGR